MKLNKSISLALLLMAGLTQLSAQKWHQVQSPNFIVVTNDKVDHAQDAALRMEQLRLLFGMLLQKENQQCNVPIRIVTLGGSKEVATDFPIGDSDDSDGRSVYIKTDSGDFIAVDSAELTSTKLMIAWPAVARGYARRLLDSNYPRTPAWFDSGFVDYFSTIEFDDKKVHIGAAPAHTLEHLVEGNWIPVGRLLAAEFTPSGPEEAERARAEAWLFIHFLYHEKRIEQVGDYFRLIMSEHRTASASIEEAFKLEAEQLDRVLKAYRMEGAKDIQTIGLPGTFSASSFTQDRELKTEGTVLLAQMQLLRPSTSAAAETALYGVLNDYPHDSLANEALGGHELDKGNLEKALPLLRRAVAQDDATARAHYLYTVLLRKLEEGKKKDVEKLFQQDSELAAAIKTAPDFAALYSLRAQVLGEAGNTPGGERAIRQAIKLQPRMLRHVLELAHLEALSRHFDPAEQLIDNVRSTGDKSLIAACDALQAEIEDWRKKPFMLQGVEDQSFSAPEFRRKPGEAVPKIDDDDADDDAKHEAKPDTRPLRSLKGTLQSVDCSAAPSAILTVSESGGMMMKMKVADVKSVILVGQESFECSWVKKKVRVNYKSSGANMGDVVSIEIE